MVVTLRHEKGPCKYLLVTMRKVRPVVIVCSLYRIYYVSRIQLRFFM